MKHWIYIAILGGLSVCVAAGGGLGTGVTASPPGSGAMVKGTVKFQGTVPKPTRIDMSADVKCVQARPSGGMTEDIVADGEGLQNVIVYVSQGLGDAKFEPPKEAAMIDQKGCM